MATVSETILLEKGLEEKITRFDIHQIIQHAGLMTSFILLVITGLPLKFHDAAISQWWVGVWGGIESTRSVHAFAAWVMTIVCLYHLVYLWYNTAILKKPFSWKMIPNRQDFIIFAQEVGYFLGLRKERAQFDRFNWREKFDYWAMFWGIPVMAGSGFILMYPVLATKFLPGWIVPTALVAHSDEAMLALIWIFLVHTFFNHFVPGVFPINTSIFTGKVPRERYRQDHLLEYQRIVGIADAEEQAEEEQTEEEQAEEEQAEEEKPTGDERTT